MFKYAPQLFILLAAAFFFSSCAATYRSISPDKAYYNSHDLNDAVGFSYKYDILRENGNKKYARKEQKVNMRIVAVRITNNTDSILNIGSDMVFYAGGKRVELLDPGQIRKGIRQIVPTYFLYLLITPFKLYISNGYTEKSYNVGYILGPSISIANVSLAASANSRFERELNWYDIRNRNILPGETIHGIIGFRDSGYSSIQLKKVDQSVDP